MTPKSPKWTPRDAETLNVVRAFVKEWGVFPPHRALCELMGFSSTHAAANRLARLEVHGCIERYRVPHVKREQLRLTGKWPASVEA